MFRTHGTPSHPDVHYRVCSLWDGPFTALAHDLVVERTLKFGDWAVEPRLTLAEFAQILAFASQSTKQSCDDGDCRFQSRSFAFTCLAALAPSLPPRESGEEVDTNFVRGTETEDDAVFELGAEAFLGQAPWLVRDSASMQALELIKSLKDDPREMARARLYH
ncbi:hypothetical protein JVT61DRAFT_4560 [Boletus reticuloceps]|uniref:Uncharacterized protein n=1 Tax=Boletus reticuloceps TaxID=495285 RepID=A0A8I2YKX1_9AGAM|nr:hypothetical protein JVT61DRAFT_4560 [Boletus reticuloceps]